MAVTQNTYTGDGTTVLFSFTFPYLETTDIKVSVNGTNTTAYTLANATTIQFNTAPANGAAIRIYRQTDDSALAATFYPGSAIRSADLNENFTQNLYVTQESNNISATATTTANTALTNSNTAISTANSAVSTANTASANASAAVSTANTASSNASAAVSTANTASSNATAAVNTANTASTNASNAVSTANTALSTANTASSNASAAVATANTASSNASAAVSTANTASSNATTAVNTANNALSTANAAQSTANTADANANAALNAIAGTVQYVLVANVAAIPSSPGNGDAIEIADSTGIESFSPLNNRPAGFVGDSGLSVRLQYLSAGSSWNWLNYFANNSETRYLKFGGGTITGNLEIGNSGSLSFEGSTANAFETTLAVTDPTADRIITLPDQTGNVIVSGNATIVNADVNASAAIAGTKISPDFGSQNVTTTGTVTAANLNATSSTIPANGIYLPAANTIALASNSTKRLEVDADGKVGIGVQPSTFDSTANRGVLALNGAANGVAFTAGVSGSAKLTLQHDGTNSLLYNIANGYLAFGTNNTERARISASGDFSTAGTSTAASFIPSSSTVPTNGVYLPSANTVAISTNGTGRLFVDSSGNVGLGTTAPVSTLNIRKDSLGTGGVGESAITLTYSSTNYGQHFIDSNGSYNIYANTNGVAGGNLQFRADASLIFNTASNERGRFDSSGRLLVGTSSDSQETTLKLQGSSGGSGDRPVLRMSAGYTPTGANQTVATLTGENSAASAGGSITFASDGAWTNGSSHPTRLVFSTCPDSGSSPVERLRISSAGTTYFGITSDPSSTVNGFSILNNGVFNAYASGNAPAWLNRNTSDGKIVSLRQDDIEEGTISVSGTTVSYNGAHLSRWSQLPSGAERTEILRGSVLSNIDEMCEWGDEDNEQLNRMKVSDVEGDKNVSGVFQAWDDDDDTYTNDFYCAMTGDFIIRIAADVTVERGDLLMSAGDGTAKPQDDDIIRSKTIAKVTSTNVSCTYDDGSYCVPCVLMAC